MPTSALPSAFASSSSALDLVPGLAPAASPVPSYSATSARVKSLDVHPTNPWVLAALYDGHVVVHDLNTKSVVKTIRVSELPVRAARFVARENWIVAAGDDYKIHVVDLESGVEITAFTAHGDYVRALLVHATKPLVISCGDDMLIKVWDWTNGWTSVRELRGHEHYAMATALVDADTIASVGLDSNIKLWQLAGADIEATTTLTGHASGVNAIAIDHATQRLITGGDDRTLRVWDLETRTETAAALGHTHNITAVVSHPTLPLVFSASEDESVRVWTRETLALEATWSFGLGRVWTLAVADGGRAVAVGCDRGLVVVPVASAVPASRM